MKGEVKERGMIFNDEMVRAILEGRKTQTRRIMKNQPAEVGPEAPVMVREIGAGFQWYGADGVSSVFNCPFGSLAQIGVRFVPIPVETDEEFHRLAASAAQKLEIMAAKVEKAEGATK